MKADEPWVGPIERRKVYELVAQRLIDDIGRGDDRGGKGHYAVPRRGPADRECLLGGRTQVPPSTAPYGWCNQPLGARGEIVESSGFSMRRTTPARLRARSPSAAHAP